MSFIVKSVGRVESLFVDRCCTIRWEITILRFQFESRINSVFVFHRTKVNL